MGSKKNHQDSAHQILQGLRDMKVCQAFQVEITISFVSEPLFMNKYGLETKEIFLQHSYTKNLSVPQAKQAWPKTELQKLYF